MSYSMSSDASESEGSSSFSCRRSDESPAPDIGSYVFGTSVMLPLAGGKDVQVWDESTKKVDSTLTVEVEMMKERFAKLLLGEDMSGGGRGVCAALAISNAITNLSATVFGNLWRLEPLDEQKKAVWRREIGWLLCVSDSIVEFVPSIQQLPCGGTCEVMITQPRSDLHANLPALKKLHALLLGILDGFRETEFSYIDPGCRSVREEDKWWLPCPTVPENGLSDGQKKRLQDSRYRTEQILKAAMAINNSVLAEMEIPSAYFDALSMSERAHLGESIYNCITADQFAPECLVECLNLSSEHQTLKVVNRVEAAVHLWRRKDLKKLTSSKSQKFSLSGKVKSLVTDGDMNHLLAERAESLLRTLRLRFPNLPQTSLDMSKIQHNKDVGQAILESYSRVMESLAFNIMARIDDLIFADDANKPLFSARGVTGFPVQKRTVPSPFTAQHTP